MSSATPRQKRVFLIGNPDKPSIHQKVEELAEWVRQRARLVGTALSWPQPLRFTEQPDLIIVLGGDGTLLGVARSLGERQLPIAGVNLGKLGYLAEFSIEELRNSFDQILTDPACISPRPILEVTILRKGKARFQDLAINDCVIHAGPPFRMIELSVRVNDHDLTTLAGDGLVIATPGGSTAHNMSAGGPIIQGRVEAIVLTPLCPHSLTHRPVVVEASARIEVLPRRVNQGTTASLDGQVSSPLAVGDQLLARRYEHKFLLIRNPAYPPWNTLITKLGWGQVPGYG